MNSYAAAQHYQKVLRNVAEHYSLNEDDAEAMKEAITLHDSSDLEERYGPQPKVIWDDATFELGAYELRTAFGWIDLSEFGLKEEAARSCEAYNSGVLCFYE